MRDFIIKWVGLSHVWHRLCFLFFFKVFKKFQKYVRYFFYKHYISCKRRKKVKQKQRVFIIIYSQLRQRKNKKGYQAPCSTKLTFQAWTTPQINHIYKYIWSFKIWAYIDYNIFCF